MFDRVGRQSKSNARNISGVRITSWPAKAWAKLVHHHQNVNGISKHSLSQRPTAAIVRKYAARGRDCHIEVVRVYGNNGARVRYHKSSYSVSVRGHISGPGLYDGPASWYDRKELDCFSDRTLLEWCHIRFPTQWHRPYCYGCSFKVIFFAIQFFDAYSFMKMVLQFFKTIAVISLNTTGLMFGHGMAQIYLRASWKKSVKWNISEKCWTRIVVGFNFIRQQDSTRCGAQNRSTFSIQLSQKRFLTKPPIWWVSIFGTA